MKAATDVRKYIRLFVYFVLVIGLGCSSPEERIFSDAMSQSEEGSFEKAVSLFDKVVRRAPDSELGVKAAKEGARISRYETRDLKRALEFLKLIVIHSQDAAERLQAQRQIASIYFDNLLDYKMAISEYTKLLQLVVAPTEIAQIKIILARSYFYLGDFKQAEVEIKMVLPLSIEPDLAFSARVLYGNIRLEQKAFGKAADIYKQLIQDFPEKAIKENIYLSLSVCYEEVGDFPGAIKALETLKPKYSIPEYIDLRIKRVLERQRNLPGARGFRK